jgi:hypothetical protein
MTPEQKDNLVTTAILITVGMLFVLAVIAGFKLFNLI